MKVKMFGIANEIVGGPSLYLDDNVKDAASLRSYLIDSYPEFSKIKGFMIAINHEYAEDKDQLKATDEIAILPPVSGG